MKYSSNVKSKTNIPLYLFIQFYRKFYCSLLILISNMKLKEKLIPGQSDPPSTAPARTKYLIQIGTIKISLSVAGLYLLLEFVHNLK